MKNVVRVFSVLLMAAFLQGCSAFDGFFSESDLPPLKGERVSILQAVGEVTADPALKDQPIVLPQAWTNEVWPQTGGYPSHAMGHLTLGKKLKKEWSVLVGARGYRHNPLIVQPVVANGMVFTMDAWARVTAFDTKEGKRKWRAITKPEKEGEAKDPANFGGGIAFSANRLFVTNGYKELICLDPSDGKIIWRIDVPSITRSSPTVADGKVYVITLDNRLMVYSTQDGSALWNYSGISETTNVLGTVSPAVEGSLVVLPLSTGELVGLRAENGQVVWSDNLSAVRRSGILAQIGNIRGQPVIDQGIVYASSYSGRMVALDAVTGQRLWQREIGSAETPWSAGETVFVLSNDQRLMALDRKTGGIRWITELPSHVVRKNNIPIVWTGPVLAGGRLILTSSRERLVEVDPMTGTLIDVTGLGQNVMVSPVVANNTLYLLTEFGDLRAYR